MNTLSLADLVLDYADAAGIVVRKVDADPLEVARVIITDVVVDGEISIRLGRRGWVVTTTTEAHSNLDWNADGAIRYALLQLVRVRTGGIGSKSGRRESIKREGLWLAKSLIGAAHVRLDVTYTEDGFLFERVLVRPQGYGAWSVYVNVSRTGIGDEWTINAERVPLRIAFGTAIQLTLEQRMEEFER